MWRGHGRSFGRSADAASGGYEQWSQQTRCDPSAEQAARYAMPTGFGAPAATAMTPPAVLPPGVAFTPAPFGMMMKHPWAAQVSSPGGCEWGGAGGGVAGAAPGYGCDGAADDGGASADVSSGYVCAGAGRDYGGTDDFSTAIRRSECNGSTTIRRRRYRRD